MKKLFLILTILSALTYAVFAATSTDYAISAEVIDLGGASMQAGSQKMYGKIREIQPLSTTGGGFTLESSFLGIAYANTTSVNTFEIPVVSSIHPNAGSNDRSYRVIINGQNISTEVSVSLTKTPQTPIPGTTITVESSTSMECDFDLTGAQTGAWNVVVINTGYSPQKTGTLTGGFTVSAPGPVKIIGTPVNEPNPFNPSTGTTDFKYKLSNNANISLYLFNQNGEIVWQKTYSAGQNGGRAGDNNVTWNGATDFEDSVPTGVYVLRILSKSGDVRELGRIKVAVLRQ